MAQIPKSPHNHEPKSILANFNPGSPKNLAGSGLSSTGRPSEEASSSNMTQSSGRLRPSFDSTVPFLKDESDSSYLSDDSTFLEKYQGQDIGAVTNQYAILVSRNFRRGIPRMGLALLPSFLQGRVTGDAPEPAKLHGIAALDGIRGFACLLVFNYHLLFTYTWSAQLGWGYDDNNRWIVQLPFIRLFYSGHLMVFVFFVVSGYVLSHKPLKLMRNKSFEAVLHTVCSSVFRRALRLFMPTLFATFCTMLLVQAGFFKYATAIRNDGVTMAGCNEQHPPYFPTFTAQFWNWWWSMGIQFDPWNWGLFYGDYDPHLWTIALEFRGSMILFLTLIGFGRLRPRFRLLFLAGLLSYCIYCDRWEVFLFLTGIFIAEVDLCHGLFQPAPLLDEQNTPPKRKILEPRTERFLWNILFVIGLYLGSCPSMGADKTPGYRWLLTQVPKRWYEKNRFWQAIGGIFIVWSINRSKDLQPMFTTRFAQYMGKISYAFYIVHGPILHSIGYMVVPNIWKYTGKDTAIGWTAGFVLGSFIILPITFWAADLFWRFIDIPCVNFAKWFENKVTVALTN